MEQVGGSKVAIFKAGVIKIRRNRGGMERVAALVDNNENKGEGGSL